MFQIAVCDDQKNICSMLKNMLLEYAHKNNLEVMIFTFEDSRTLLEFCQKTPNLALIFLDIEMPELDGIQLGAKIRQELKNDLVQIVYISSHESYALRLFENRPLNFIIKTKDPKAMELDVIKNLNTAMKLIGTQNRYFEFISNRVPQRVSYADITYFESLNKQIILHTTLETYTFYEKLSEISERLSSPTFTQIHKSYIINSLHLQSLSSSNQIVLKGGVTLPISRAYKKKFYTQLFANQSEKFFNKL